MSNVVPFRRTRPRSAHASCIIQKVVNGELVECVNIDALSPRELVHFFFQQENGAPQQDHGAPNN